MSTSLQLHTDTMADWGVIRQQAEVLIKTGFLPQSIKTPEQAMAIILTGRELGIGAMQALNTINVIQGKPTISPQLMLALINRSGQLEDMAIEVSDQGAKCMMKRKGKAPYVARFGLKEAQAMGLSGKDNYKKQPATMYKWRAVADAARVVFPDVILGLYTPDEMGAQMDEETGEVVGAIETEPEPIADYELREEVAEVIQDALTVAAVRSVKLEGVQPTGQGQAATKGGKQIMALIRALKWSDEGVCQFMDAEFGYSVESDDLAGVFDSMDNVEQEQIIKALKGAFKGGTK